MTVKTNSLILLLSILILGTTSCKKDEIPPIELGVSAKVNNTFQSDAFTNGVELAIEDLFMTAPDALSATASVSEGVEFPAYLLGLYDINISEESISFDCVADTNDPNYGSLFRVLEPNTFDRYYFVFDSPHNITSSESDNNSVSLNIISETEIVVVIGEGYDFNPDINFTIQLSN